MIGNVEDVSVGTDEARATIGVSIDSVLAVIERQRLDSDGELAKSIGLLKLRAASNEITLAVLGEFSSGKTSFINKLLSTDLLETGILPTTAVCTYIRYGSEVSYELCFKEGKNIRILPSEVGADLNTRLSEGSLDHIMLHLPAPLLKSGLSVVDTPGVNVNIDAHEAITRQAIGEANACLYLMDARQPGKKTTIDFLRRIHEKVNKTFFVLNRADILDADEQKEALEFVADALKEECGIPQPKVTLLCSQAQLSHNPRLWNERFEEFQRTLQDFMRSERDSVIYAELASLLTETIKLSENLLASKCRLAEDELSSHYEVSLPDAVDVIEALREQSTIAVAEDSIAIKSQFLELHATICGRLRDVLENEIATARTTAGLVEVGSTKIAKTFEEHANGLQMFLSKSFETIYTSRQAQVRASVTGLFSGVRMVDQKALLSKPTPWICIVIGAMLSFGLEHAWRTPPLDQAISPFLGMAIAAVIYGIYLWDCNRTSFSPPSTSETLHSDKAWAAVSSGAVYQDAESHPVEANMAPASIGRAIGTMSGNPIFNIIGASISAATWGYQLLSDKLSGRLDKLRNEMRESLKPVLDDFEEKTSANGLAAIYTGERAIVMSLTSVLDVSMERYRVVLERLLKPHRRIKEKLEQRRNEIFADVENLRVLRGQVIASLDILQTAMRGHAAANASLPVDTSEHLDVNTGKSVRAKNRVRLLEMSAVPHSFEQNNSLTTTWSVCLATAVVLTVASLALAGVFHASQAQTAIEIVTPATVASQPVLAENNSAAIQSSGEDRSTADAQAGDQQNQLSASDPTNAAPTAGDTSENTTGSTENVRGTTQDVIGSKRLNTQGLSILATMHPDFNEAKREFGEAVQLDSGNIEALNNLGYTYGRLGDYQSAETYLLQVVKIAPMRRAALGNLGYIEAKLGKTNEAAQYFCQYVRKFDSLQGGEEKLIHTMADPDPNVKEALAATLANCTRD